MRPIIRTLSVSAAIAFAFVAGCSSADTKRDYVDAVSEARGSASDAFNQVVTSTSGNRQETVEQLEAGGTSLAASIKELESVDVPEEAEARHSEVVADFSELRMLFEKAADDARRATGTEVLSVLGDLASEGRVVGDQIDDTLTKINHDLDAD